MFETAKLFAKSGADCTKDIFFGIPHWAKGLEAKFGEECALGGKPATEKFALNDVWIVVANVTRMALALAALLAIGFIIFGGITYITSKGNPEHTKRAQDILTNAVLGLIIAIFASAIVGFIAGRLN